jgi:outer membrane protein OmpA-like peptidoglycan-associated protein
MKQFISTILISFIFGTFAAQNTGFQALLNVTVTDMELNPSPGDKIIFISLKSGKTYTEISDKDGKFQIKLPVGSDYEIKIKTFDQEMNYLSMTIPAADYDSEFDIGIKYEMPKTYTLKDVLFNTGSAVLMPSSYESLDELAEYLLHKTSIFIELAGHTDSDGDDASNLTLSQKRAETCRNYLIKKGVPENRVYASGYGETQPLADNDTDYGKQLNRRTEVRIIK